MKRPFVLAAALSSSIALAQGGSLPANHPPLPDQPAQGGAMPEGHPPVGGAGADGLPHDHPPMGSGKSPGPLRKELRNSAPSAEELLEQLSAAKDLPGREKSFEVASAMSRLFYQGGRYAESSLYFRQALAKTDAARKDYARMVSKWKAKELPAPTAECPQGEAGKLADQHKAALALEKTNPAAALGCLHHALRPVEDVRGLLAQSLFLEGKPKDALAELDALLAASPGNGNAHFTRAAIRYETAGDDVAALKTASADFNRFAALEPKSQRASLARALAGRADKAVEAGGLAKLNAKEAAERTEKAKGLQIAAAPPQSSQMPQLSPETVEAFGKVEQTPELQADLQKFLDEGEEHLARGRYQEALDSYKKVMPFQPGSGRVRAGMAWSLVGLGKGTADKIWSVAVQSDPGAVDALGDSLQKKGDAKGAKALWQKLAQTAPEYARTAGLEKKTQ